jgi:hypothetical protein
VANEQEQFTRDALAIFERLPKPGFLPRDHEPVPEELVPDAWKGNGNFQTPRHPDGSISVIWSMGRPDGARGELRVWYEEDGDRVTKVELSLPDGLKPRDLARFPWATYLPIAESARRVHRYDIGSIEFNDVESLELREALEDTYSLVRAAAGTPLPRDGASHRPGRKGHPLSHYARVAKVYLDALQRGDRNPTQRVADDATVSRSTAAGWVRGARERGYLPPGREGKAG